MTKIEEAKDYLKYITMPLVEFPMAVTVEDKLDELGVTLTIRCDKSDTKYLIGREGAVAHALRVVMQMYGRKHGAKFNVYIP